MCGIVGLKTEKAVSEDLKEITEIYNWAVLNTTATFDTEAKSFESRKEWFEKHDRRCPVLICRSGNEIAGWGSLSLWSERKAYSGTVELSVFVHPRFHGQGVGSKILSSLIEIANNNHFKTMVARISEGNEGSVRLFEKYGFHKVGTMEVVGRKFDKDLDVFIFQRHLTKTLSNFLGSYENIRLVKVTSTSSEVVELIEELNAYNLSLYPPEACSLDSPEVLAADNCEMIGAYFDEELVGIGALKILCDYTEIKRMFVKAEFRRKGISSRILARLLESARLKNVSICRLETGIDQLEAIGLYRKFGFRICEKYGDYKMNGVSVFMEKSLGGEGLVRVL